MEVRESKNDHYMKEFIEEDRKEEEKDPISQMEEAFLRQRGVGIIPTPADYHAMARLIEDHIPLDDILEGIDYAFRAFKPKHTHDRIRSFAYCGAVIRDRYVRKQAKLRAQKVGKRNVTKVKDKQSTGDRGDYQANSGIEKEIVQGYYSQFPIFASGGIQSLICVPVLIWDDIGKAHPTPSRQSVYYHVINE
ncbi:hypothetical protein [Thermoflavimicrobium daqui]|uniref:Uncharacterized protein n=1 Tax=Thermoflavimicrobium daqui TaxID=2137476 RepID=A0A364K0T3_9BACL|nr:hypothetical protein [Thermoflavimicrobium daqui]RAL21302.1 hypothetical protein DL897_16820 [Thermoflavimicrobium daqui]